jgi:hypothetical protein
MTVRPGTMRRLARIAAVTLLTLAAASGANPAEAKLPAAPNGLEQRVALAIQQAGNGQIARFPGGYYDPTTREVYLDEGKQVLLVTPTGLIPAPDPAGGDFGTLSLCNGQYTHCEYVAAATRCQPARTYLNYYPADNRYADVYGSGLPFASEVEVRDAPYRRYGPTSVRVYMFGRWGFMHMDCLSG